MSELVIRKCVQPQQFAAFCKVEFAKLTKFAFFGKIICTYEKKAVPLHRQIKNTWLVRSTKRAQPI